MTILQRADREGLGSPELFVQTAAEREAEVREQEPDRQVNSLLKLVMLAKQEITQGRGMTTKEVRQQLREARK
jgi:hypothetical protein